MNILVTGGAGFIGSHLSLALESRGHDVTILDNLHTGSMSNLEKPFGGNPFRGETRLESITTYEPMFDNDYDQIYNLACPASPPKYQANPLYTLDTNINGIQNILKIAEMHKSRFLQASTSEVYGDPLEHPQSEDYHGNVNIWGPRSCYDEGKRCAETICYEYMNCLHVDVRVARIFNTYGPHMNPTDGRVVSNFIVQALQNKPITIYGDGEQTRSFCYINDMVEGLIRLMDSHCTVPINLGNPVEFTILELAEKILSKTKSKSKLSFQEKCRDDPKQRQPVITRASAELGWIPQIDLDKGLDRTIEYFKKRI